MKLVILTLNWNGEQFLKKLAPSLLESLHGIEYQWVVKDNGSKDNSIAYLSSLKNDNILVLPFPHNRQNFSEGVNYCYQQSSVQSGDLVLLLNNDTVFNDKKSIRNMIDLIRSDQEIGVVGARLLYSNTNQLQHAGVVFDNFVQMPLHFRAKQISDARAEVNREFQAVTGAVLLTTAKCFSQACTTNASGINGLDEKFHWAFDDIDFCLSVRYNLNKKIVYCGNTNIFHEESASLKKNPANKLFMNNNVNLLKEKWLSKIILDHELYKKDHSFKEYKGK